MKHANLLSRLEKIAFPTIFLLQNCYVQFFFPTFVGKKFGNIRSASPEVKKLRCAMCEESSTDRHYSNSDNHLIV